MRKSFRFALVFGALIWPLAADAQSISLGAPTLNINTTPIVGGTNGKLFYDNAGTIGEFTLAGDCTFAQPTITCASAGLTIGTSIVTSGTDTRVLFQDGTTVGENANFTFAKTPGTLTIPNGALSGPSLVVGPSSGFGFYKGANGLAVVNSSADQLQLGSNNGNIPTVFLQSTGSIGWSVNSSSQSQSADLFLLRKGAANLQLGNSDAAAPVAQTISVQNVAAGTSNTAGVNTTFSGSQGTGTGAGGSFLWKVAPAGASGTAQNALSTVMTLDSTGALTLTSGATTKLGIGIASPYGQLHVHPTTNQNLNVKANVDGYDSGAVGFLALNDDNATRAPLAFVGSRIHFIIGDVTADGDLITPKHYLNTSAVPVASACGTSPTITANSTNASGQFTTGTATPTACTITFATAYPNAAFCTISPANSAAAGATVLPFISTTSASAFTITMAVGTSSAAFNYVCGGK